MRPSLKLKPHFPRSFFFLKEEFNNPSSNNNNPTCSLPVHRFLLIFILHTWECAHPGGAAVSTQSPHRVGGGQSSAVTARPPHPRPYSAQHLPGTTETAQHSGTQMTRPPSWRASVPPLLSAQLKHHSGTSRSLSPSPQDQYSLVLFPSQSCRGGTYTCALTCPHFTCEVLSGPSGPAGDRERMGRAGKWEGQRAASCSEPGSFL